MDWRQGLRNSMAVALGLACAVSATAAPSSAVRCEAPPELLLNAGVESGAWAPGALPAGWSFQSWSGTALGSWDGSTAHSGQRSLRIDNTRFDDARWQQTVATAAGTRLYLSGWLRTQGVQRDAPPYSGPGANLSIFEQGERTGGLDGTSPWTSAGVLFRAQSAAVTVAPRLGYFGGLARGTAWFDDLSLRALAPMTTIPRWRVLLLVYPQTDAVMPDRNGRVDRALGQSSAQEVNTTIEQARRFFQEDVPALSSGYQMPELTVRVVNQPLSRLSRIGDGWRPSSADIAADLDSSYDAVVVVWEPRIHWMNAGQKDWIGYAAGLTDDAATRQAYITMSIEYAGQQGHRNVYKHEFGHALLFYFDALGVTPGPRVENHAIASQYVNCRTGLPYVWLDETDANPIPNSIYANAAGFTHDYYSGQVALATAPQNCLGIGPQAWAWGGPASHSGVRPVFTGRQRVQALAEQIDGLRTARLLSIGSAAELSALLDQAGQALDRGNAGLAHAKLTVFGNRLRQLQRQSALSAETGARLADAAEAADSCVKPGR